MELIQYIRLFRKWFWLLLLATCVGGGMSFIISRGRPSVYQAQTTIAIGAFIESPNPDSAEIRTGIDLAQTYAQLVETHDVLQGTIDALDLPLESQELEQVVTTRILTGTSLLVVSVDYANPITAAAIADSLAEQLISQSPTNLTPAQQAQVDFANSQIEALNQQLEELRTQLELIETQLQFSSSDEVVRLTGQRNITIDQINSTSTIIAQFSTTLTTLQQRTNALEIVERAQVPTEPTGVSPLIAALLGVIVGGAFMMGIVLLREYLDNTIRTTADAAQALALPVLGGIVRFGRKKNPYSEFLITRHMSTSQTAEGYRTSPVAEGYRTVRTNLLFGVDGTSNGIFLVTSAGPEEGKSLTAANLAVVMAQAGLQVLLIDCDLHRPKQHEIFGLRNVIGLTTLLNEDRKADETERLEANRLPGTVLRCIQTTTIMNLRVMTSGPISSNSTELFASSSLKFWMEKLQTSPEVDVVILDTPPCLTVTDSSLLAVASKADVLLVVDCNRTQRNSAQKAKEQFTRLGVSVRGVIVNRINPREESYMNNYGSRFIDLDAKSQNTNEYHSLTAQGKDSHTLWV